MMPPLGRITEVGQLSASRYKADCWWFDPTHPHNQIIVDGIGEPVAESVCHDTSVVVNAISPTKKGWIRAIGVGHKHLA